MRFCPLFILCVVLIAQTPVKVAPYYTPGVGTENVTTAATTDTSIDILAVGPGGVYAPTCASSGTCGGVRALIPRSGPVFQIALYLGDTSNLQTLYFSTNTCATNSASACLTFTPTYTASITGPFTASAVNTFTLATPLMVNKWDALGVRAEWSTPHAINLALFSAQEIPAVSGNGQITQPAICQYQLNAAKQSTFTLASMTVIPANGCVIIGAYMSPPAVVGIGDSIMSSAPAPSDSVADCPPQAYPIPSTYSPTHFWVGSYIGGPITYQGMGWNGQTAVQIAARFATDAVALRPHYVLIDGGVNDLNACSSSGCTGPQITTIENALTSMMSAAQAANITPVVMLIGPWSTSPNGTNARMLNADTINANTISVAPTYGAVVADWRCTVGQFRSGGSAGNCWDWQTAYLYADGLGVHPNQAGVALIGALIASLVPSLSPTIAKPSSGVAW